LKSRSTRERRPTSSSALNWQELTATHNEYKEEIARLTKEATQATLNLSQATGADSSSSVRDKVLSII